MWKVFAEISNIMRIIYCRVYECDLAFKDFVLLPVQISSFLFSYFYIIILIFLLLLTLFSLIQSFYIPLNSFMHTQCMAFNKSCSKF